MAYPIRFYTEDDDARGANNDGLPDVMNRPIRDLLAGSGYLADGSDFDGFARLPDVVALASPFMTQAAVATDATPVGAGGATNQRSYTLTGTFNAATERQLRIFSAEAVYQGSSVSASVVAGAISTGQTGRQFTGHISSASGLVAIGARLISSGVVDRVNGLQAYALARGGTVGNMRGVVGHIRTINDPLATDGPTTVTGDAAAFYVEPGLIHASTAIAGNTYGFYMDDPATWGGTVTGKRYGFYIAGGDNYIGGGLVVGNSSRITGSATATRGSLLIRPPDTAVSSGSASESGDLFVQVGTGTRTDGVAQTVEFQLRRNAQGFAQFHFHNVGVHEWKIGTDSTGLVGIWNDQHELVWSAYQEDHAPNVAGGPRTGYWQDFYGNIHQTGQIVQDVLHDGTWISTSLSSTTPASSQNAWITKATIDANDSTSRQFRAFYGWTQYRGSGVSTSSVQGGLFYGETAENFTGGISQAVGSVNIGSRLVAGTGVIGTQIGSSGVAFTAGGPTTNMWGLQATVIALGTSTISNARGLMIDVSTLSATTTVTDDITGVYIKDPNAWGGIGAAKRYAIYSEGGAVRLLSAPTVPAPSSGTAFLLNAWGTSTDATPTSFGTNLLNLQHVHTNNSASARQPRGLYVINYYNGSGVNASSVQGALFEAACDPTFTGTLGSVVGLVSQAVRNASAGSISTALTGLQATAASFSGTGTINLMQGLAISLLTIGATHTITEVRGLSNKQSANTLGTAAISGSLYGAYFDDVTTWGATVTGSRYSLYVLGGDSYFGGPVRANDHIESLIAGKGIYLRSPGGTRYLVTVSNAGALSVVAA